MKILEVCCGSYEDAVNATMAKADRIELNSALYMGGLTPSMATFLKCKEKLTIPIICMVRNRGAGFNYSSLEKEIMFLDAKIFLDNKADGIAFGFLNDDLTIDIENTKKMVTLIHSYNKEAVFHRAFDVCTDLFTSMETLISLKVDRVLTSGGYVSVLEGRETLKRLQERYKSKIQILMGGGINEGNLKKLLEETQIYQVHSSCKKWNKDLTSANERINYNYSENNQYDVVSLERASNIKAILNDIN